MSDICNAFRTIVSAGVSGVYFDCEKKEILIVTEFGERYFFKVQGVRVDEEADAE